MVRSRAILLGLTLSAMVVLGATQASAQTPGHLRQQSQSASTGKKQRVTCPCMADPFFEEFATAQRPILTCTDNTAVENFVRLVAPNLDLVVLFELSGQLYCGEQPDGFGTSYLAVSGAEFDYCQRLMMRAANSQGIPCLPDL